MGFLREEAYHRSKGGASMKKIRNKTYFFLLGLTLFMVWFLVGRFGLFASNGDWFSR